jgi:hypothetical protein
MFVRARLLVEEAKNVVVEWLILAQVLDEDRLRRDAAVTLSRTEVDSASSPPQIRSSSIPNTFSSDVLLGTSPA